MKPGRHFSCLAVNIKHPFIEVHLSQRRITTSRYASVSVIAQAA